MIPCDWFWLQCYHFDENLSFNFTVIPKCLEKDVENHLQNTKLLPQFDLKIDGTHLTIDYIKVFGQNIQRQIILKIWAAWKKNDQSTIFSLLDWQLSALWISIKVALLNHFLMPKD